MSELSPMGCEVVIRSDGTGAIVNFRGLGGYTIEFEWREGITGTFEVRAVSRDDGGELDPEFVVWHPAEVTVVTEHCRHSTTERLVIRFGEGLLLCESTAAWIDGSPLFYEGEPSPS
jgi:hypothetical protein